MSWLSKAWKALKGGRSDAETAFGIAAMGLKASDRAELASKLKSVQFATTTAAQWVNDPRIDEADKWVRGALEILGE